MMYYLPELFQAENYLVQIQNRRHFDVCKEECYFSINVCDEDVNNLCQMIMEEEGWKKPSDPFEAVTLYEYLRQKLSELVDYRMNMHN